MALESIPDSRTFLETFAKSSKWNESTANRLTAVAEEALLTLLNHNDELDDDSRRQHLLLTVSKDGGSAIVEVIAAHGKNRLEDCIGLISEHNDDVSMFLLNAKCRCVFCGIMRPQFSMSSTTTSTLSL